MARRPAPRKRRRIQRRVVALRERTSPPISAANPPVERTGCDLDTAAEVLLKLPVLLLVFVLRLYQRTSRFRPRLCRFYPSCSEYAVQALRRHGAVRGSLMAVWRLCRCHPFHPGGYDPVEADAGGREANGS
jgi:putative membrane protein insertion efficiency factor